MDKIPVSIYCLQTNLFLTKGSIYTIDDVNDSHFHVTEDDWGKDGWYPAGLFKTLQEERDRKLKEILSE